MSIGLVFLVVLAALTYGLFAIVHKSTSAKVSDAALAVGDDISDKVHSMKRDVGRAARDSRDAAVSVAGDVGAAVKDAAR